ncbi:5-oxoprolinase subunit B family protein [Kitasatospora viridis]|uniref:KipI family sensor histidine kinase inhibitor n=1 Tax=Kitasatospora viridis TaxID=281105 RepID=A0A561UP43_9ACTN|nr:allophanate hydrolase subunit 1 [Kitasatospora viridis]TWG01138.1 KipI family sensor histidine kinase inhibitor [Kitasatospora viridis]
MGDGLTVRRVGEGALLLEVAGPERVAALYDRLLAARAAGTLGELTEIVPAARTVLLDGVAEPAALARRLADWTVAAVAAADGPLVDLPTVYDGPDLPEVAALWGVTVAEVVRRHSSLEHRVAFCGFAPGFAYLTGLPTELAVPRRATPRPAVPAGSVAVAGRYTGVYPGASPGGWQLLGRTAVPLWDTDREPAALLAPGVRVRFTPIQGGPDA